MVFTRKKNSDSDVIEVNRRSRSTRSGVVVLEESTTDQNESAVTPRTRSKKLDIAVNANSSSLSSERKASITETSSPMTSVGTRRRSRRLSGSIAEPVSLTPKTNKRRLSSNLHNVPEIITLDDGDEDNIDDNHIENVAPSSKRLCKDIDVPSVIIESENETTNCNSSFSGKSAESSTVPNLEIKTDLVTSEEDSDEDEKTPTSNKKDQDDKLVQKSDTPPSKRINTDFLDSKLNRIDAGNTSITNEDDKVILVLDSSSDEEEVLATETTVNKSNRDKDNVKIIENIDTILNEKTVVTDNTDRKHKNEDDIDSLNNRVEDEGEIITQTAMHSNESMDTNLHEKTVMDTISDDNNEEEKVEKEEEIITQNVLHSNEIIDKVLTNDCKNKNILPTSNHIAAIKEADQLSVVKARKMEELHSVPRGMPKSGRWWKPPQNKFSSTIQVKPLKTSWAKKMQLKKDRDDILAAVAEIKFDKKQKLVALRERQKQNKERKEINARKSEIVQVIKDSTKIKRMKKKQLRMIAKRDLTMA